MKKLLCLSIFIVLFTGLSSFAQQPPLILPQQIETAPPALPAPPPPSVQPPPPSVQPPPPPPVPAMNPNNQNFYNSETLLGKVSVAIKTAKELKTFMEPGGVIVKTAPNGEIEIKGTILYKGAVIATIHFSPETGNVLPLGLVEHTFTQKIRVNMLKQNLTNILKKIKIANSVSFAEPEKAWRIYFSYNNFIIGEIKIYYNGVYVIPDYASTEEMRIFGK